MASSRLSWYEQPRLYKLPGMTSRQIMKCSGLPPITLLKKQNRKCSHTVDFHAASEFPEREPFGVKFIICMASQS